MLVGESIVCWVLPLDCGCSRREGDLKERLQEIMKRLADGAAAVRVALHQVRSEVGSACCFLIREKSFG